MAMLHTSSSVVRRISLVALEVFAHFAVSDLHLEVELLQVVEVGRPALLGVLEPVLVGVGFLWRENMLVFF